MFVLSVVAVVLTGSLMGSAGACFAEILRDRRIRRENEVDYKELLGPSFGLGVQPVRVSYRTSDARKSRLVLQDFSQPEALAA